MNIQWGFLDLGDRVQARGELMRDGRVAFDMQCIATHAELPDTIKQMEASIKKQAQALDDPDWPLPARDDALNAATGCEACQ